MNTDQYMDFGISQENLMQHLSEICRWERLSGTAEELEAFQYLERELKKIGAKTELIFHDAYISLPEAAKLIVDGQNVACHTASMAKSTSPSGISGTLVLAPTIKDLTEELCRGKIVLIDGTVGFGPIHKAWKCGAAAVIGCPGEHFHEKIISNAWGSPTPETKDLIPDIPYVSILSKDFAAISEMVKSGKPLEAHVITLVKSGWAKIPLLIADITASNSSEQYVMFSGHLDSWYYGATDNGTANCIQLEVARIAMQNREKLERNLKVVFYSGHSHGRYAGSAWHVDNYWQDIHDHCVININADIIGGKGATDLTRSIIMPEARDVAVAFIKAHAGVDFKGGRCGRNGDQSYYITGVSSAFSSFSKQPHPENLENKLAQTRSGAFDFGWWWHTEEDLIDKVEPGFFLRDAKIFTSFIMYFLMNRKIPLNFEKTAHELNELLYLWSEKAGKRFDLGVPMQLSKELENACSKLYASEATDVSHFNNTIMRLGRILVPLNYTTGNIYENDPGIPLPPIPSLQKIDDLTKTPVGSDEEKEILVALVHKRNFITHSFIRALRLIQDYLDSK